MQIKENVKLAPYTTYKIGGEAKYFAECKSEEDILESLDFAKENNLPYFVLGGGSNVLVADRGYSGLIISIQNDNYKIKGDTLHAEAGVVMQTLVEETTSEGRQGLEWAGGLPGQLGGAIRGNAGAFGGEIKDSIKSVRAITPSGKIKTFKNKNHRLWRNPTKSGECDFSYRSSIFKEKAGYIILSAEIKIGSPTTGTNREKLLNRAAELVQWRQTKHPMEYGNCGSIFKRKNVDEIPRHIIKKYPNVKNAIRDGQIATAFFIDEAGLKLKRVGGAEVSEKHPNFIINRTGKAKSEDVIMLSSIIKSRVLHQFGILIEEEIHYLN